MAALFIYSLVLSASLTLLWIAYRVSGLSSCGRFRLCRAILLGIIVTGVLISLLPFAPRYTSTNPITVTELTTINPAELQPAVEVSSGPIMGWIVRIYLTGLLISLAYLFLTHARIIWLVARSQSHGRLRILRHSGPGPFAWGRWIVLSPADYTGDSDPNTAMLIAHESAHLEGVHWIDLVIVNIVICLTWYWPAARLLRRSLMTVHEFIADRSVIEAGFPTVDYQMMLIAKASRRKFAISAVDSINNVSLKTRIIMMRQSTPGRFATLRGLVLLPAVILAATLASSPALAAYASANSAV